MWGLASTEMQRGLRWDMVSCSSAARPSQGNRGSWAMRPKLAVRELASSWCTVAGSSTRAAGGSAGRSQCAVACSGAAYTMAAECQQARVNAGSGRMRHAVAESVTCVVVFAAPWAPGAAAGAAAVVEP